MIEGGNNMNHPKSFILALEYHYGYTFKYGDCRKFTSDKVLKSHCEVLTQEVLVNCLCTRLSGSANKRLKLLLTSLISSLPAACEIINTEQESTKQRVKQDAVGVFMKHESKN